MSLKLPHRPCLPRHYKLMVCIVVRLTAVAPVLTSIHIIRFYITYWWFPLSSELHQLFSTQCHYILMVFIVLRICSVAGVSSLSISLVFFNHYILMVSMGSCLYSFSKRFSGLVSGVSHCHYWLGSLWMACTFLYLGGVGYIYNNKEETRRLLKYGSENGPGRVWANRSMCVHTYLFWCVLLNTNVLLPGGRL